MPPVHFLCSMGSVDWVGSVVQRRGLAEGTGAATLSQTLCDAHPL